MNDAIVIEEIICPKCQATIAATAVTCPQCGGSLVTADAKTHSIKTDSALNKPWVIAILLLHVGLLGIPVYWSLNYSISTRLFIIAASILYTVFAVGVIVFFCYWLMTIFANV